MKTSVILLRLLLFLGICGECWTLGNDARAEKVSTDSTMDQLIREVKSMKIALNQIILRANKQEKQLSYMRERIVILKRDNTELKRSKTEFKRDITDLKKDNTKLKKANSELKNRVRRIEVNKEKEKKTFALRKVSMRSFVPRNDVSAFSHLRDGNKRQDGLNHTSNTTGKRLLEHYFINPRKRLLSTGSMYTAGCEKNIGFTVHRFRDNMHLNAGQTIIFNEIVSNIGGLYNANTGIFHADTAGIYVFYVNILCLNNRYTKTELVKDGISLSIQVCDGRGHANSNGSSMTVIDLSVGVSVWVRVRNVDSSHDDELGSETSFSGFLLKCT